MCLCCYGILLFQFYFIFIFKNNNIITSLFELKQLTTAKIASILNGVYNFFSQRHKKKKKKPFKEMFGFQEIQNNKSF